MHNRTSCHRIGRLPLGFASVLMIVAGLLVAPTTSAVGLAVINPRILGAGEVHEVRDTGAQIFYWTETQGIEHPEVDAAIWETTLSAGDFRIEVFIPKEFGYTYARYQIANDGTETEVRLRQSNVGGEWITLDTLKLSAGATTIRSTDSAGYPLEQLVWAAARFTPVAELPPAAERTEGATIVDLPEVKGPAEGAVRFADVGWTGAMIRVYAQGTERSPLEAATWDAEVQPGEYEVLAYIPAEHAEAEATYTVDGSDEPVQAHVTQASFNDIWVPLANANFRTGEARITANDATGHIGDELAWSAIKLVPKNLPEEEVHAPSAGSHELDGSPSSSLASGTLSYKAPAIRALPLVHQLTRLALWEVLRVRVVGNSPVFRIARFRREPRGITLSYRCAPCVFVSLRHSRASSPVTRGPADRLVHWLLKQGTRIVFRAAESGHTTRSYVYALRSHGEIDGPHECVEAVPALSEAGATRRCPR
jgi:hypothetical protein